MSTTIFRSAFQVQSPIWRYFFLFAWIFRTEKIPSHISRVAGTLISILSEQWMMLLVDIYNYMSNLPRYHIFLILSFGYLFYYLIEVVKVSEKTFVLHSLRLKFHSINFELKINSSSQGTICQLWSFYQFFACWQAFGRKFNNLASTFWQQNAKIVSWALPFKAPVLGHNFRMNDDGDDGVWHVKY